MTLLWGPWAHGAHGAQAGGRPAGGRTAHIARRVPDDGRAAGSEQRAAGGAPGRPSQIGVSKHRAWATPTNMYYISV